MTPTRVEQHGMTFVEGRADAPFLLYAQDVDRLIEVCFGEGVRAALLYATNMPATFFDLSSGDAGIILQKVRTYGIQLAVVAPQAQVTFSRLFGDMLADEQRGAYFGVFDTRQQACDWMQHHRS